MPEFDNGFDLTLRKASSFSVVKRIPETDGIRLGEVGFNVFYGWFTLTQVFRDSRVSPIPKCRAGCGTLPDIFET